MRFGHIKELDKFNPKNRDMLLKSVQHLSGIFTRNANQLKSVGISVEGQVRELESQYGIKTRANTLSELKRGLRYKCGYLLLYAIKDYWDKRGFYFSLDE